jgi:hypothetical protein
LREPFDRRLFNEALDLPWLEELLKENLVPDQAFQICYRPASARSKKTNIPAAHASIRWDMNGDPLTSCGLLCVDPIGAGLEPVGPADGSKSNKH